jgi:Neuraminidase (sialidase)
MFILAKATNAQSQNEDLVFSNAAMPSVAIDQNGVASMVFAKGNSLFFSTSSDNGLHFSPPLFIDILKDLMAVAGRGPQIVFTKNRLNFLVSDKNGNIYSYTKTSGSEWMKQKKVNDVPDVAKEGFISVAAKGDSLYAVWLDLRGNEKNKIVGSLSTDGGRTWQKNKLVYQSPFGSVCECCKPSASFGEKGITVMFRNNLDNFRDLYIVTSTDGGNNFSKATKLGTGTWKINGCPMDGGGLRYTHNNIVQTIWRRNDTIFTARPNEKEKMIGIGKNCSLENAGNEFAYAWVEKGEVVCMLPNNKKMKIAEVSFPFLISINNNDFICVWHHNGNIYRRVISL